jgi:hypothetical protein
LYEEEEEKKESLLYVRRKLDSRSVLIHFLSFYDFALYIDGEREIRMSKSVQSNDTLLYISNIGICIRFKYRVENRKRREEKERAGE